MISCFVFCPSGTSNTRQILRRSRQSALSCCHAGSKVANVSHTTTCRKTAASQSDAGVSIILMIILKTNIMGAVNVSLVGYQTFYLVTFASRFMSSKVWDVHVRPKVMVMYDVWLTAGLRIHFMSEIAPATCSCQALPLVNIYVVIC